MLHRPAARTPKSTNSVTMSGYVLSPGETVSFQAVDQNTGGLVSQGSTTAASTGSAYKTPEGAAYTLYPWTFNAGTPPANFWAPQSIAPDLATSQGHLEIFASAGGNDLLTFSQPALNSVLSSGLDPVSAGLKFSDGRSTVLFDSDGVGSGPETAWVNVMGMISTPLAVANPLLFAGRLERWLLHGTGLADLWPHLRADVRRPLSPRHLQSRWAARDRRRHQRISHCSGMDHAAAGSPGRAWPVY